MDEPETKTEGPSGPCGPPGVRDDQVVEQMMPPSTGFVNRIIPKRKAWIMVTTSCQHEARIIAKNIAALHSRLMEQPDATPAAAAEAIRKMITEIDRQTWERITWLGGHYCPDWDQMWLDRKMPAWDGCTCAVKRGD